MKPFCEYDDIVAWIDSAAIGLESDISLNPSHERMESGEFRQFDRLVELEYGLGTIGGHDLVMVGIPSLLSAM